MPEVFPINFSQRIFPTIKRRGGKVAQAIRRLASYKKIISSMNQAHKKKVYKLTELISTNGTIVTDSLSDGLETPSERTYPLYKESVTIVPFVLMSSVSLYTFF